MKTVPEQLDEMQQDLIALLKEQIRRLEDELLGVYRQRDSFRNRLAEAEDLMKEGKEALWEGLTWPTGDADARRHMEQMWAQFDGFLAGAAQ